MATVLLFSDDFADSIDRSRATQREHDRAGDLPLRGQSAEDTALLSRIRESDESAFTELFRRETEQLYKVATALLGSSDAAADVVQSVMHRFWMQRGQLTVRGAIGAYLRVATVNAARNAVRSASRARNAAEQAARTLADTVASTDEAVSHVDRERRLLDTLERAIAELPERTRHIFLLWWAGEMTYAEIARATGISVKGVERARARALDRLRKVLVESGFEPG